MIMAKLSPLEILTGCPLCNTLTVGKIEFGDNVYHCHCNNCDFYFSERRFPMSNTTFINTLLDQIDANYEQYQDVVRGK